MFCPAQRPAYAALQDLFQTDDHRILVGVRGQLGGIEVRDLGDRGDELKATDRTSTSSSVRSGDNPTRFVQVAADPEAASRSRISVLLANRAMDQTLTITHVLWAMYGVLPKDSLQPPHRHQSVALDLILDCRPGCYTMLGDLDDSGQRLVNTERIDWEPGAAFITPPGRWHSHHNESGADAELIPIQDAGLHTYLRTLDIRFMSKEQAAKALDISFDISPSNSLAPADVR
ncbi:MAG: hypothetical protein JWO67_318 [Streptosporangiaceae bacterium]|nr:hypothetical protein [Streptosporangiaceae bacterium]